MSFYSTVLERARTEHGMTSDQEVLVVCGGLTDRSALVEAGLTNVVISNLDERIAEGAFDPFRWSYQDAENLSFEAAAFDWVVVHAGLHHCAVPQRALAEMVRVARRGIIVVEARDSLMMRAGARLGLVGEYEVEAVIDNRGEAGGLANTEIPNFVYRWTEREVHKSLASAEPTRDHQVSFYYDWRAPVERLTMSKRRSRRVLAPALRLVCVIGRHVAKRQGNCFGVIATKSDELKPWLRLEEDRIRFDRAWGQSRYRGSLDLAETER